MLNYLLRSLFERDYSFFEVISLFVITSLTMSVSLWWLLAYLPVILITTTIQVRYKL